MPKKIKVEAYFTFINPKESHVFQPLDELKFRDLYN